MSEYDCTKLSLSYKIEAKDRELEEARAIIQNKEQDIEQIMRNSKLDNSNVY